MNNCHLDEYFIKKKNYSIFIFQKSTFSEKNKEFELVIIAYLANFSPKRIFLFNFSILLNFIISKVLEKVLSKELKHKAQNV